ncbi:MAG: GNAT family N-acetyltransferase [Sphingobacteriia bacterium 24-36-13]|jgi:N-acetylglutamate synthase-like GNAT family acetyltransferase|uniref:GNAT family N-acetyltransferase n=1 Tax=Sediminibacterium sp. TaxID=1917865 RepID=UPI000BCC80CD|nr:GNAT family N-acetyltransferase [Sediminibacterium sp.]OYY11764.1 MAG: GNAT family N-acetyltransferase [Sphingobacteriia bacterium 35-36-14]OYZ53336.1 MAG: GNAT family N-acetyltransferase [Sphingobacteriia bacterium 24-36-13]OZA64048.1 MAG: GNAT family N-acetyltransferase [Sphingobacteriia bacterium 39-36-14]HQS23135.1 GNAT family N-acetyltransferase [Sediminibacterium sp.]HQS34059.1 GNAT family N-acetyltransferase [Sediminibacterium sp.]
MALKMIQHGSGEYEQMVALRHQLLRKPLGLHFSAEELANEKNNILLAYTDDGIMEACSMLVKQDDRTVRLRQLAVLSGLQGKGIGRAMVQFAENLARDNRFQKIIMHARQDSIHFFEKLGYEVLSEPFIELTIPHVVMGKEL